MLANTTDHLQLMDISMNKLAKDFLKRQFDQWYSEQVVAQLEGEDASDLESLELQPINPSLASLDEAKWLVDMATYMYISDNSKIINPRRACAQGYCSRFVCLSVCLSVCPRNLSANWC